MVVKYFFNILLTFFILVSTGEMLPASLPTNLAHFGQNNPVQASVLPAGPTTFEKLKPEDNALYVNVNGLALSWTSFPDAISYEYCVDTTGDNACATAWISTGLNKSVTLNNLPYFRAHYWQVRAVTDSNVIEADEGAWFMFITASPPPAPFNKVFPPNGVGELPLSLTLTWEPSTGIETTYDYCLVPSGTACTWKSNGSATSVAITGLAYGTTYTWQVRAKNSSGSMLANAGVNWIFTTQMAPPAPFGKLTPGIGASDQPLSPTLTWEASTGEYIRYEYCITDTTDATSCDKIWYQAYDETQVALSGLKYSTPYRWQVRAINPSGILDANSGALWEFTTQNPLPSSFSKLTPVDQAANQPVSPVLTWSPSQDAADYIYCVDDSDNDTCDSTWVASGDTFAVPAGLIEQKTYYWQVKARNAEGETAANNAAWWSFTTRSNTPAVFSKLSPLDTDGLVSRTPWLSWTSFSGADSYQYAILEDQPYPPAPVWVDARTSLSIQVPASANLQPDTTYLWQVRAIAGGDVTEAGLWWSFTTLKEGPTSTDQLFDDAIEDQPYVGSLAAVSNYGKSFSLAGSLPPGVLSLSGDGHFTYTPPEDFTGTVSFDFNVWDGYNPPSNNYTATIMVQPVNDAPVLAFIPNQTVNTGQIASFTVIAQDADLPYGDQPTLSIVEPLPTGATFNPATGLFHWMAVFSAAHPEPYSFTVKVADQGGLSDTQLVTVSVVPFHSWLPLIFRP